MPRELSTVIQNVLATRSHNAFIAYDILLRDGITTIRGAEIELVVTSINVRGSSVVVDPVSYDAKINDEPDITFRRSGAERGGSEPTGGEFSIIDLSHDLGVTVSQVEDILTGARIVLSNCFAKPDGKYEADIYFKGLIRDCRAEDEKTVLTVISDKDSRTAIAANRSLTQRCLAIYGDDRCGRPAELIAPGETCSNIFDDGENGCLQKRWQFRFFGIPILRLTHNGSFGWGGGEGDPGGGGGECPDLDAYLAIYQTKDKFVPVKVRALTTGMITVDARGRCAVIDHLQQVDNVARYEAIAANGARIIASREHPLIRSLDDTTGLAMSLIKDEQPVVGFDLSKSEQFISPVISRQVSDGSVMRITLSNTSASLYLAGMDPELMFEQHNRKPILPP